MYWKTVDTLLVVGSSDLSEDIHRGQSVDMGHWKLEGILCWKLEGILCWEQRGMLHLKEDTQDLEEGLRSWEVDRHRS